MASFICSFSDFCLGFFSSFTSSITSSIIVIVGIHSKASSIRSSVDFLKLRVPPFLQDSIKPVLSSVFSKI